MACKQEKASALFLHGLQKQALMPFFRTATVCGPAEYAPDGIMHPAPLQIFQRAVCTSQSSSGSGRESWLRASSR